MKKMLLVAAVAGIGMTSCKKDYTCECVTNSSFTIDSVTTSIAPSTTTVKYDKTKKEDAKFRCEGNSTTATSGDSQNGVSATSSCSLK